MYTVFKSGNTRGIYDTDEDLVYIPYDQKPETVAAFCDALNGNYNKGFFQKWRRPSVKEAVILVRLGVIRHDGRFVNQKRSIE
jgi:hypothetical protein